MCVQVLDLNDPKLVQAIWKPEVYAFKSVNHGNYTKDYSLGVFPKCEGSRVPVCDRSKPFAQYQTPGADSLYAQVNIIHTLYMTSSI